MSNEATIRAYRILVVDDHPIVRQGYALLLSDLDKFEICAEAETAPDALQLIRTECPDLVIVDLTLKDSNGLELIKQIRISNEDIKILAVSVHDENLFAERVLKAGGNGFINKQEATNELVEAIKQIKNGAIFLTEKMKQRLLSRATTNEVSVSALEAFSDRELEVFEQIGKGISTVQIASNLFLSPKTIERYRENIKRKLGISNSVELVRHATLWVLENQ